MEQKNNNKFIFKRSRATQVDSEDLYEFSVKRLDSSNVQAEKKPIKPIGREAIIPQCRFCLRRVSRANLDIIRSKHKPKAQAAFEIRVFTNDAYPFACANCLNMIDIFLDFKTTVTKARNLLLDRRIYLESDGWDDPVCIEAFNQCKIAVERHRMQIDAIYDEQIVMAARRNGSMFESEIKMHLEEQDIPYSENYFNDDQSAESTNQIAMEPTIELELKPEAIEAEHVLISHANINENVGSGRIVPLNVDEHNENRNLIVQLNSNENIENDSGQITPLNVDITPQGHVQNDNSTTVMNISSVDEGITHVSKRRRTKVIKYAESEQESDFQDEDCTAEETNSSDDDDDDFIPKTKEVASKTCTGSTDSAEKGKKKLTRNTAPECKPPSVKHVLCDLCGEKMRPETVEGHKNRHLGIKPYTCPADGCEWTFHGRSNMSLHMRRRHPENGVPCQQCDICGKYVKGNRSIFNQHKKRHFLKDRSHICPVCGKGFTLDRYLRQHSIVHTGLLPFACSYCGKKFNNKWSMRNHEKNLHEKKNQTSASYDQTSANNDEDPNIDAVSSENNYVQ